MRSVASLFMLAVAGSGVRKTQVDNAFLEQAHAYDKARNEEHQKKLEYYESALQSNKFPAHVLRMKLRKLMLKNVPVDSAAYGTWIKERQAIAEELSKVETLPMKPRLKRLLYSQISPSTLERRLHENWPAAGLFSNEAGDILGAKRPADLSQLDRLWDGQPIDVERPKERDSVSVSDPRLTLSLMVQPSVFERFLEKKGEQARGIGFLARTLICRPDPMFGMRTIEPDDQRSTYWLNRFNRRVSRFAEVGHIDFENRIKNIITLQFSPEAQKIWRDDYNENEKQMLEGGELADETDFASRYSEHVARVAALFYFFEKWDGDKDQKALEISPDMTRNAISVCQWYRTQFRYIFNQSLILERNAKLVVEKLYAILSRERSGEMGLSEFMGRIPRHLRKKEQFAPVRRWLINNKMIVFFDRQNVKGVKNPVFVTLHIDSPESKKLGREGTIGHYSNNKSIRALTE